MLKEKIKLKNEKNPTKEEEKWIKFRTRIN